MDATSVVPDAVDEVAVVVSDAVTSVALPLAPPDEMALETLLAAAKESLQYQHTTQYR